MRKLTEIEKHENKRVEFAARHGFLHGFCAGLVLTLFLFNFVLRGL